MTHLLDAQVLIWSQDDPTRLSAAALQTLQSRTNDLAVGIQTLLPAHRLQLAHDVPGAHLITLIKAWTEAEGKKDQAILVAAENPQPAWPWSTLEEFAVRLSEANAALGRIRFAPDRQVFTTTEVLAFVKEASKG